MGLSMLPTPCSTATTSASACCCASQRRRRRRTHGRVIGPFWDANETWLVLGVGAAGGVPVAHGVILGALYLPVALMLVGLILRGVAFDFRVKARARTSRVEPGCSRLGSLLAALAQGYMLGAYITGFERPVEPSVRRTDRLCLVAATGCWAPAG
jgi:cytochrome bd-type quinol oxidase subunit 2